MQNNSVTSACFSLMSFWVNTQPVEDSLAVLLPTPTIQVQVGYEVQFTLHPSNRNEEMECPLIPQSSL